MSFLYLFYWYFFQLVILLKPHFNCCNSFKLCWIDRRTTGTETCVSVYTNIVSSVAAEKTWLADQVRTSFISHLIFGISWALPKLVKYFNCRVISTSLLLPAAEVLPATFAVNLKDLDTSRCFLNNYYHIILNYTLTSIFLTVSICALFFSLVKFVNVTHFSTY